MQVTSCVATLKKKEAEGLCHKVSIPFPENPYRLLSSHIILNYIKHVNESESLSKLVIKYMMNVITRDIKATAMQKSLKCIQRAMEFESYEGSTKYHFS